MQAGVSKPPRDSDMSQTSFSGIPLDLKGQEEKASCLGQEIYCQTKPSVEGLWPTKVSWHVVSTEQYSHASASNPCQGLPFYRPQLDARQEVY